MDKNSLLALISSSVHDMKTPLTSISGFAEAMLDGNIPEEQREKYLRVIKDEASRLSRICEELLTASRIETGTEVLDKKPFSLTETARRALISLEGAIEERKLSVDFDAPDELTAVGDGDKIMRAIYNLCHNAVKFSHVGGRLGLYISEYGGSAVLKISNEGEEICAEELESIFLPFYKKDKGGTGLGLYIAKSTAEAHGGSLFAESGEGVTVFTMTVPTAKE